MSDAQSTGLNPEFWELVREFKSINESVEVSVAEWTEIFDSDESARSALAAHTWAESPSGELLRSSPYVIARLVSMLYGDTGQLSAAAVAFTSIKSSAAGAALIDRFWSVEAQEDRDLLILALENQGLPAADNFLLSLRDHEELDEFERRSLARALEARGIEPS